MSISKDLIDQLTKGLEGYDKTLYGTTGKISAAIQPVAFVILLILYMVEITSIYKKLNQEGGEISIQIISVLAMKYLAAFVLINAAGTIINSILWFGIQITKHANSVLGEPSITSSIPSILDGKVSWWAKPIVFLFKVFAWIAMLLADLIARLLILIRMLNLYLVRAIAPILVAFYMNDETKSMATGFFKHVGALVLQGVLILLIIGFIPVILSSSVFNVDLTASGFKGAGELITGILSAIILIVKYVVVIILLIGSQNLAKRLVGAN